MPRISVQQVGSVGVVKDLSQHLLPLPAWTDSNNVRFLDKKIDRVRGTRKVFGTPTQAPQFTIPIPTASAVFWVYFSLTDAFVWDNLTHNEITRLSGDYTTNLGRDWNGGVFGGILTVTNGSDLPQYWPDINVSTLLEDLTTWPSTLRCKLLRPFKSFLVALNLIDGGTAKPHRVRWSHSADPGTLPNSWDINDPTKDAGEVDLTDVQAGEIKEAQLLGDSLIIYKTNSTWAMRFVGGSDLFKFDSLLVTSGVLSSRCVCPIKKGTRHFLHNGNELVEFDGQSSPRAITDDRWARFLRNDIDTVNFANSFCFDLPELNEAWFCYPSAGATFPDKALIWNYEEDTIYPRDFSGRYAATGRVEESLATTWDDATQTWDSYEGVWNPSLGIRTVVCDAGNTRFYMLEDGNQFVGQDFTSYIEKLGMAMTGVDRFGNPVVDIGRRKMFKRLWPKITGGPVKISFASQQTLQDGIQYTTPVVFDPANGDEYVDSVANGRLLGFRIEEDQGVPWGCEGYEFEIEVLGEH